MEVEPAAIPPAVVTIFVGADIILRADDGHTIHVHKQILKEKSELYNSMFLVGPGQDSEPLQIVSVPLPGSVLLDLLQILYKHNVTGTLHSPYESIEKAIVHLHAAEMLQFPEVEAVIKESMGPTIANEKNPLSAWATAVRLGLAKSIRDAAALRYFQAEDPQEDPSIYSLPALRHISALQWNCFMKKRSIFIDVVRRKLAERLRPEVCSNCYYEADYGGMEAGSVRNGYGAWKEICKTLHPFGVNAKSTSAYIDTKTALESDCHDCQELSRERIKRGASAHNRNIIWEPSEIVQFFQVRFATLHCRS